MRGYDDEPFGGEKAIRGHGALWKGAFYAHDLQPGLLRRRPRYDAEIISLDFPRGRLFGGRGRRVVDGNVKTGKGRDETGERG